MRLRSLLAATAAIGAAPLAAAAQDAPPLVLPPYCSVVCQRDVAFDELKRAPQVQYEAARGVIGADVGQPVFEQRLKSTVDKFEAEHRRITGEIQSWEQLKRNTELAFAIKDDAPLSDTLPTSTVSTVIGQSMDAQISRLEAERDALAAKVLGPALEEIRAANAEALRNLEGKTPQEVHQALFGPDGRSGLIGSTDVFNRLDAEGKADLANLKVDILQGQLAAVSAGAAHTQQQVDALVEDYNRFKAAVAEHVEKTRREIDALKNGQRALTRAYETLRDEVRDNTYRLDALEGVMWTKLSAREQIDALRGGAFASVVAGMSPEKRAQFEADLEQAAKLEKIYNAAGAAAQVANDFAAIGAVFNIDLAEPAARINQAATVVQSAIQIASGQPLAVISGLGGLARVFGGGGDGTSAALAALRRDIMQMRQEMYEYHVREMKALEAISRQIDERFTELAALQAGTLDQIGFNTLQLDELLKDNLNACVTLSRRWRLEPYEGLDERAGRINLNDRYLIIRCRDGIEDRFYRYSPSGQVALSTIFSLQALTDADRAVPERADQILAVQRYRDETLLPTLGYILREHPYRTGIGNCRPDQVAFAGLLGAPKRDGDLRAEAEAARRRCAAGTPVLYRAQDGSTFDVAALLGTPLSITNIAGYGRTVHDVASVWEFVDSPGAADPRIMTLEQMRAVAPTTGAARADTPARQLRKVLDLVNLSVAQVNLLGGDLVLEVIAQDVEAGLDNPASRNLASIDKANWSNCTASGSPSARYFNALCVLQRNEALRYNFVRHWTRTRLENPQTTPFRRYAIGMTLTEPTVLAQSFRRPMPVARCGETWCLKLPGAVIPDPQRSPRGSSGAPDDHYDLKGDMWLPMPRWPEVATDRQAVATPQIDLLLGLRRDLAERISELVATRKLTEDERRLVYAALVVAEAERDPATAPGSDTAQGPVRPDDMLRR